MNQRHSEPFYISPRLFDISRFKRRRCRWTERLRERQRQRQTLGQVRAVYGSAKTDHRGRRNRRHMAAALPAEVTIDLLSDEEVPEERPGNSRHQRMLLIPTSSLRLQRRQPQQQQQQQQQTHPKPRSRPLMANESILITSDDEETPPARQHRSPPPLAPLSLPEAVEEVTVSLVPRSSTTAQCQARQRHSHPPISLLKTNSSIRLPAAAAAASPAPIAATNGGSNRRSESGSDGCLEVDVGNTAGGPADETTVHTVIANRIYELSLSKLREGLASSGVPEYANDLLPEQLQKLSPALRAKVAPLVAPSPPAPISLKLSSDLSISLISDDDDCDSNGHHQQQQPQPHRQQHQQERQEQRQQYQHHVSGGSNSAAGRGARTRISQERRAPEVRTAAEAHAAAKLLKQQQPQLSVVQHLQYAGGGLGQPVALALPVHAASVSVSGPAMPLQLPRRRKLG